MNIKTFRKVLCISAIVLTLTSPFTSFSVSAIAKPSISAYTVEYETYTSDVIEYIYRTYNGKLQYRRWNATKGIGVDPHWIDIA